MLILPLSLKGKYFKIRSVVKINPILTLSLALPDNFVNTNNGKFSRRKKEPRESSGRYEVKITWKIHLSKNQSTVSCCGNCYFVHLNKEKKTKSYCFSSTVSYSHFIFRCRDITLVTQSCKENIANKFQHEIHISILGQLCDEHQFDR